MEIKRSHVLVAILLTGSVVTAATFSAGQSRNRTATAEEGKAEGETATDGQKWEYCSVSKAAFANSPRAGVVWISYFRSSGVQVVNVEDNATSDASLAKALARVGEEGWELVGLGPLEVRPGTKLDAYYFKRPKR